METSRVSENGHLVQQKDNHYKKKGVLYVDERMIPFVHNVSRTFKVHASAQSVLWRSHVLAR